MVGVSVLENRNGVPFLSNMRMQFVLIFTVNVDLRLTSMRIDSVLYDSCANLFVA